MNAAEYQLQTMKQLSREELELLVLACSVDTMIVDRYLVRISSLQDLRMEYYRQSGMAQIRDKLQEITTKYSRLLVENIRSKEHA